MGKEGCNLPNMNVCCLASSQPVHPPFRANCGMWTSITLPSTQRSCRRPLATVRIPLQAMTGATAGCVHPSKDQEAPGPSTR
jgi:hypothetical protein